MSLPKEMEDYVNKMLGPLQEENERLHDDNAYLKDQIAALSKSNKQISRDEYEKMKNKLQDEIEANKTINKEKGEMQREIDKLKKKNTELITSLNQTKDEIDVDVSGRQRDKEKIDELTKERDRLAKENEKYTKAKLDSLHEKKNFKDTISELEKTNKELRKSLREIYDQNEMFKTNLYARTQQLIEYKEKAEKFEARSNKLKALLDRYKNENPNIANDLEKHDTEQNIEATINYDNIQIELANAKEKIKELKSRILDLEEEERRNVRLTEAINQRTKKIEDLQNQLDEKEEQILQFHRGKNELFRQVDLYKERIEEKYNDNIDETEDLRKQAKMYKEYYEMADKRIKKLEKDIGEKMKEADESKRLLNQKLEGTHGLKNVVNEMKELRAMLDVRDRHIADLIQQLNSMDKIMIGLSNQIDPNFDLNAFIKDFNTQGLDDEKIRTENAKRDLNKKIQMMKDRGPTAQIKFVLDKDQRPIKTIVYENDQESFSVASPQLQKNKHRVSDANASDSLWVSQKQHKKFGQKRFKPKDNEDDKIKTITSYNEKSTQTEESKEDDNKFIQSIQEASIDRDEWVVNLQRKYSAIIIERDDLKRQLEKLLAELAKYQKEDKSMNANQTDLDKLGKKPDLVPSVSPSSLDLDLPTSPLNKKPIFDRSNYTDRSSQTKKPKFKIDNQISHNFFREIHLTRVNYTDSNNIIIPSEEQQAIFRAKQDADKIELKKLRQKVGEYKHQIEILQLELDQLQEIRNKMQETIDLLNKQLIEQRERYKENLTELRHEADRFADSKVRNALDVHKVSNRLGKDGELSNLDDANLDKASMRMKELNHMKMRLEEQLNEERASSQLAQKQCLRYQERLYAVEKERDQLKEELERRKTDNKLTDYNAELHIRMRNLEKKYQDLRRENNELKQSRPARNDPKRGTEHPIDESDTENNANFKNYSVIRSTKSAEAKIMTLKTQNEEMQLKLGKAQGTIDRLNQLLQRKEGQVEKFKEQASSFKHQLLAKQKEVNILRAKLHP